MDTEIPNLSEKMHFLHTLSQIARRVAGLEDGRGLQTLCKLIGISREAIRDQIAKGKIRSDFEILIAKRFQFHEREPAWAPWREGTSGQFKTAYEALHNNETKTTAPAHIRVPSSPDLISTRPERPWSFNDKLASITLFANQEGGGAAQPLAVELVCTPAFIEIVEMTVRRGELFIDCGDGEASDVSERAAFLEKEGCKRNPPELGVSPFGSHVRPGWKLSIASPPETGWYITGEICEIRKLAVGGIVTAWFAAYIKDLEPSRERVSTEQASAGCHQSRAFILKDFMKLSMAKKRVLELMAVAPAADEDGYAVLCKDSLRFNVHPGAPERPDDE